VPPDSGGGTGKHMKISTKGRYALRLMLDLALHNTGEPISLKDIAKRENISDKYLEQIISVLNKAGYVQSIRGAQGGYLLKKNPEEYTVGMILRLTEGSLAPVSCVEDESTVCDKEGDCVTVMIWKKMNEAINDVVDHITLADMVSWKLEKNGQYVI
jgi:Rrf2 family protein